MFKGVIEYSGKAVRINNTVCAVLHRLSSFTIWVDICNNCETGQKLPILLKMELRLREVRQSSTVRLVKACFNALLLKRKGDLMKKIPDVSLVRKLPGPLRPWMSVEALCWTSDLRLLGDWENEGVVEKRQNNYKAWGQLVLLFCTPSLRYT